MIKITNLDMISKELDRNPILLIKYFRKKLGVAINKKYEISALVDASFLEELLEMYIKKHVLCRKCNIPETDCVTFVCRACGSSLYAYSYS